MMNIDKLEDLERALNALSGFTHDLVELESTPNLIIPSYFGSRDEYRNSLLSDIRIARKEVSAFWDALSEFIADENDSHVVDPNWLALDPNH